MRSAHDLLASYGMLALQRRVLVVRELIVVAVRLVARRDDHRLRERAAPRRLEQRPRAAHVGVERRDRIAVRDADDRLRGEMEDGVDLVFRRACARARPGRARRRARSVTLFSSSVPSSVLRGTQSRTSAVTLAPSSTSRRTSQPPSRPVAPVTNTGRSCQCELFFFAVHFQVFQGGEPPAHSDSRWRRSRNVSIGCQNPSCRKARSCPSVASRSSGSFSQSVSSPSM